MSSLRGKKATVPASKKRKGASSSSVGQVQLADAIRALLTTDPWELFFGIIEPTYLELTMELCSIFHFQTVMMNYDNPSTVQFHLGGLVYQQSFPEFGTTTYNPSRSKASVLPPSLRYFHAILAHTITGRLLRTAAQESSLTLIGQMSPQGISSMLSMRMIEKHRGTYPPQYHLAQSTKEEALKDITDDGPPQHEDPPSQPPPPSRPVHATDSYANIFERLTRFEQ
ncbi:hypothetical protein GOBAR_AA09066 [Gossypium barbadense]|uniref:Uncharacterized protein n=1 Tax=Gossypium barbadense TaxID=3634 RepID=A0A2P5Y7N1_GOSBA|nr:hypothetical protein GOBAR_AA09066 [Gossypium barbadense]